MKNRKERELKLGVNLDDLIYNPEIDSEDDVEVILEPVNLVINTGTGKAHIEYEKGEFIKDVDTYIANTYERENGKTKFINYSIVKNGINEIDNLFHYDHIIAVDTNSIMIDKTVISITTTLFCYKIEEGLYTQEYIKVWNNNNFTLEQREKVAWCVVIENVGKQLSENKQVAIITDHDLDNINDYNSGKKAIFPGFYLPNNFNLLYASADTGSEFITNKLISICEKESANITSLIKQARNLGDWLNYSEEKSFIMQVKEEKSNK